MMAPRSNNNRPRMPVSSSCVSISSTLSQPILDITKEHLAIKEGGQIMPHSGTELINPYSSLISADLSIFQLAWD